MIVSMPTVLRSGPYRFYFYSYDCSEPRHVHVDKENKSAKFWLDPVVMLDKNSGYTPKELRLISETIQVHLEELRDAWDDFCGESTEDY